ncbi:MAG: CsgG/HfaB family protein [Planctomycetota bacterium]
MPAALAALALAAAGCDKTMTVRRFPEFYTPQLKAVAVLPLGNDSLTPNAGKYVTRRLVDALKANRTYEVLGPAELRARLAAAGLNLPAEADARNVAQRLRRLGGLQAFITGRVTTFGADNYPPRVYYHGYRTFSGGRRGRFHFGHGYPVYGWDTYYPAYAYYPYMQAYVAVDVALVSVETGEAIYSPPRLEARASSDGYRLYTSQDLLDQAARLVARAVLEELAVVRKQVKLSPARDLRTARVAEGGRLTFTDSFGADEQEMIVVLRLPAAADQNRFRISIVRKGADEELAAESFIWSRKDDVRRFVFSPRKLAESAGPGEYEVRFHSGPDVVMKHPFKLH